MRCETNAMQKKLDFTQKHVHEYRALWKMSDVQKESKKEMYDENKFTKVFFSNMCPLWYGIIFS